jgi:Spy/CpxP family protein refolding chaperone
MLNRCLLSAACLWLGTAVLRAQQPGGPDPLMENLFPPELVMAHQRAIGLSDTQKTQIRTEILSAQNKFTELQWQLQDAVEALVALLKPTPADESQVKAQLDKVLNFEREIKRTQIVLLVRIKNQLSAQQQRSLQKLRSGSK